MTDDDLVAAMQEKASVGASFDDEYATLHERHRGFLYGVCTRQLHARAVGVNDLHQETFLRLYEKFHNYTPAALDADSSRRKFRAFLATIARRLSLELLRRSRDAQIRYRQVLVDELDTNHRNVSARGPGSAEAQRLRCAMRELGDRDRLVLWESYRWYNPDSGRVEMPQDELDTLCAQLSAKVNAVRQMRLRALRRLRALLNSGTVGGAQ